MFSFRIDVGHVLGFSYNGMERNRANETIKLYKETKIEF